MKKFLIILNFIFLNLTFQLSSKENEKTFEPNLKTSWYPHNKEKLKDNIENLLEKAKKYLDLDVKPDNIKAIFVPHAGYSFSGLCAAAAYRKLLNGKLKNSFFNKVIILAPSHFFNFDGIAIPSFDTYKSPLGVVKTNDCSIKNLNRFNIFSKNEDAFKAEHSFIVQVPFLQSCIEKFTLVPLLVGNLTNKEMNIAAIALSQIIDERTLIVITSDLTHHGNIYGYKKFNKDIVDQIRQQDSKVLEAIFNESGKQFKESLKETDANFCGSNPIKMFLKLIKNKILINLEPRLVCYYNSAQISLENNNPLSFLENVNDKDAENCVSYASIIFTKERLKSLKPEKQLTNFEKLELITLVKKTIRNVLDKNNNIPELLLYPIKSPAILQKDGVFVTLKTKSNDLRGCMGRLTSSEPLFRSIMSMAKASAFEDSRFSPVLLGELKNLYSEVSVLSKPIDVKSYKDIIIGKHGIILSKSDGFGFLHSAVFLPQVATEFGWDKEKTLSELSKKANLPEYAWKHECNFQVFTSFTIDEPN